MDSGQFHQMLSWILPIANEILSSEGMLRGGRVNTVSSRLAARVRGTSRLVTVVMYTQAPNAIRIRAMQPMRVGVASSGLITIARAPRHSCSSSMTSAHRAQNGVELFRWRATHTLKWQAREVAAGQAIAQQDGVGATLQSASLVGSAPQAKNCCHHHAAMTPGSLHARLLLESVQYATMILVRCSV